MDDNQVLLLKFFCSDRIGKNVIFPSYRKNGNPVITARMADSEIVFPTKRDFSESLTDAMVSSGLFIFICSYDRSGTGNPGHDVRIFPDLTTYRQFLLSG